MTIAPNVFKNTLNSCGFFFSIIQESNIGYCHEEIAHKTKQASRTVSLSTQMRCEKAHAWH